MPLDASVIIPTYDDWHVLQICLDCLAGQSVDPGRFEIIVGNNNASPDIPAWLKLSANARIIHVSKPGSYAARNAAMREARGEALFFTDSDCRPDPHWIRNGLAALAALRPIDRIAGAVQLFPKGKAWNSAELYDYVHSLRQDNYAGKGWCATANLVTRRAAFDLVGPFDETSFSGGDKDWGLRATGLGSQIVFSQDTLVRHPARESFSDLAKKHRRLLGKTHQLEVARGERQKSTVSFLVPGSGHLNAIAKDVRLTEAEKVSVFWVGYRLRLVAFVELVRLRYLSGKPRRS